MYYSNRMAKIITTTIATMSVLLILSSIHLFNYQTAYSQMPGSQNLSSLLKNLLGPQKQVSGHYSNSQFGITDIVFPDGWNGRDATNTWLKCNYASGKWKSIPIFIRYVFYSFRAAPNDVTGTLRLLKLINSSIYYTGSMYLLLLVFHSALSQFRW